MNSLVKCIVGGLVGGVIGAVVWAVIAYQFHIEIGWVAWGVGVLVGVLARVGAGDDVSPVTGAAAALIAISAVAAGKYAAVSAMTDDIVRQVAPQNAQISDADLMIQLADEIVAEFERDGRPVNWPAGMTIVEADSEEDYPKDVWAEAKGRWDRGGPSWQAQYRDYAQQKFARDVQEFVSAVKGEGFLASFSAFDILFIGLAVVSAYGIASGAGGE